MSDVDDTGRPASGDRAEDGLDGGDETCSEALRRFAETLDELEARREDVEGRFLERLAALDETIDAVARAADEAREVAGRRAAERRESLEEQTRRLEALRERLAGGRAGAVEGSGRPGWPEGDGTLRAGINRFLRWLLRDYLEVLDRRADDLARRTDAIEPALREMEGLAGEMRRSSDAVEDARRAGDRRVVEALAGLASSLELVRHVVDAKDAELLERATAGPLRRADLILDELARQQEALLAELVDRARQGDQDEAADGGASS